MSESSVTNYASKVYYQKLASAKGCFSKEEENRLGETYDNVIELLKTPLALLIDDPGCELKIAFVKAGGKAKLADAFNEQASTFGMMHSVDVNWDQLFSKEGGFPDLALQASDVSSNIPENYRTDEYRIPVELIT